MTWLAAVLRRYSEPAEADLHRVYGIDLGDFYRGLITARSLSVKLRYLPDGSMLWQSLHSDKAWTQADYLLALAIDRIAGGNWQRGGGKGSQPEPVKRPADRRGAAIQDLKNQARAAQWAAQQATRERGEG